MFSQSRTAIDGIVPGRILSATKMALNGQDC
jgi:hypothetical protein